MNSPHPRKPWKWRWPSWGSTSNAKKKLANLLLQEMQTLCAKQPNLDSWFPILFSFLYSPQIWHTPRTHILMYRTTGSCTIGCLAMQHVPSSYILLFCVPSWPFSDAISWTLILYRINTCRSPISASHLSGFWLVCKRRTYTFYPDGSIYRTFGVWPTSSFDLLCCTKMSANTFYLLVLKYMIYMCCIAICRPLCIIYVFIYIPKLSFHFSLICSRWPTSYPKLPRNHASKCYILLPTYMRTIHWAWKWSICRAELI